MVLAFSLISIIKNHGNMNIFHWVATLQQRLLERMKINFVHVTGIFIGLCCAIWLVFPHPIIPVVIGVVPIAVLITVYQPVLLGLLFIAFSFFRLHEVFPSLYSLKIPLLLSLGTIATLAWHIGFSGKIKLFHCKELGWFYLFFGLVAIGVPLASNVGEAFAYFKNIYVKIGIMTPALAWLLCSVTHYQRALVMISVSGLAVALVTIFNKMNGIGLVEETRVTVGRELGSVLGDPNDLALVLLFPFSFSLSIMLTSGFSKKYRFFGFLVALTILIAILATQSRGGLLGILAGVGIIAWRRIPSKTLLIVGGGIAALGLMMVAGIAGRKSGGGAEAGMDESAQGRLYAWEAAFFMAVDNPISGVGINNFYFNYFYYSPHWDGLNHAVHSTWFGVLGEIGFLGLAVFLIMTLVVFRAAQKNVDVVITHSSDFSPVIHCICVGLYSGVVAFCVSGTFLTQGFTWPIYILLALTASLSHFIALARADNRLPRSQVNSSRCQQLAKSKQQPKRPMSGSG